MLCSSSGRYSRKVMQLAANGGMREQYTEIKPAVPGTLIVGKHLSDGIAMRPKAMQSLIYNNDAQNQVFTS